MFIVISYSIGLCIYSIEFELPPSQLQHELESVKTLTTKGQKKVHFGNVFHLCCEILHLTKFIVNAFQLADALQCIFAHISTWLIYCSRDCVLSSHDLQLMRQVHMMKDLQ